MKAPLSFCLQSTVYRQQSTDYGLQSIDAGKKDYLADEIILLSYVSCIDIGRFSLSLLAKVHKSVGIGRAEALPTLAKLRLIMNYDL